MKKVYPIYDSQSKAKVFNLFSYGYPVNIHELLSVNFSEFMKGKWKTHYRVAVNPNRTFVDVLRKV